MRNAIVTFNGVKGKVTFIGTITVEELMGAPIVKADKIFYCDIQWEFLWFDTLEFV